MKFFAWFLLLASFAAPLRCGAQTGCGRVAVQTSIAAARGELSLADLLAPGACEPLRVAAAQVRLGAAPVGGLLRVFDGRQIRELLEGISKTKLKTKTLMPMEIPERVTVRSAGASKTCAAFGRFVASAAAAQANSTASEWQRRIECAAAPNLAEAARLELTKTSWNPALYRWEFSVRCARPEDCVPFLLWSREEGAPPSANVTSVSVPKMRRTSDSPDRRVMRGQTVTLTWDQAGIRIVLPVTCLDGGGAGQLVRVQFKNTRRILRAEVLSDGTLRANL